MTNRAGTPGTTALALGALGVVFGDIGTSPLYAIQTVFSIDDNTVHTTRSDVYGVISLVFWAITIIVSAKYVVFILRADNDGEGGVMALAALVRRSLGPSPRLVAAVLLLGVIGAALFYGDSVITPAISVLSAVEGITTAAPSLHEVVLPAGITILTVLFAVQQWGTHQIGRLFGPVMVLWFATLAATGLPEVRRPSRHPAEPVADLRRRRSRSTAPTSPSSRWARSCSPSPAPRRSTPTWGTSAGRRSGGRGSSSSSRL